MSGAPGPSPWIRTREDLDRFAQSLARCRALAVDSESDSLHHHRPKVCLVQVATDAGEARLVDTLALQDLGPLGAALTDPGVTKVLHGADYDVTTLKRDFGVRFANLFDTMIAARFAGLPEVGLQGVVRHELGIELSKESQKDDWSRRPLTPAQEAYALADVTHLLPLHERLVTRLRELGRLEWVREESQAVAELEPARREVVPDAWLKIKGARGLAPRQLAVLRALAQWREELATATDIPAFKLLGSEALIALATRPPRAPAELAKTRGLSPRVREHAASVFDAIACAQALPEAELPSVPRAAPRPATSAATQRRITQLRDWRAREAARLGLDVALVLPQRLMDPLAEAAPRDRTGLEGVPGLRRWRIEAFGDALLLALRA